MPGELKEDFFFKGGPSEGAQSWKVAFGPRGSWEHFHQSVRTMIRTDLNPCFPDLCLGFQPGRKRCRLNDD